MKELFNFLGSWEYTNTIYKIFFVTNRINRKDEIQKNLGFNRFGCPYIVFHIITQQVKYFVTLGIRGVYW